VKWLLVLGLLAACDSQIHVPRTLIEQKPVDGHGMLARRVQRAVESSKAFSRLKWRSANLSRCLVYFDMVPCANTCEVDPNLAPALACESKTKILRPPWLGAFPFDGLYREIDAPELVRAHRMNAELLEEARQDQPIRDIESHRKLKSKLVAWLASTRREFAGSALRPTTFLTIRKYFDDHKRLFTDLALIEDVQFGKALVDAWQQFANAGTDSTCIDRCPVLVRVVEPGFSGLVYCSADLVDGIPGALYQGFDGCEIVLIQTPSHTWIAAAITFKPDPWAARGGGGGMQDFTCVPRSSDRGLRDVAQMTKEILSWEPFALRTELRILGKESASVLGVRNMEPSRILMPYREKTTIRVLVDHYGTGLNYGTKLKLSVISTITVSRQNTGSPLDYHEPDAAQQATYVRALREAFRADFECSIEGD
jgi:hypothetical protein